MGACACLYLKNSSINQEQTSVKPTQTMNHVLSKLENKNKNVIVGVVYRAHTSIDSFISDIEPIYRKINSEMKHVYIMGDFNIDLLKTDMHRPIHDYVECIYSNSMLPSIL